jgi:hypothetical protein
MSRKWGGQRLVCSARRCSQPYRPGEAQAVRWLRDHAVTRREPLCRKSPYPHSGRSSGLGGRSQRERYYLLFVVDFN